MPIQKKYYDTLPPSGLFPVPAGSLAMVVTLLSCPLNKHHARQQISWPEGFTLEVLKAEALPRIRKLVSLVGEPWLWWELAALNDQAVCERLNGSHHFFYALRQSGQDIGLCEFDTGTQNPHKSAKLFLFGLAPKQTGQGTGKQLMQFVMQACARAGATSLDVETCTLDHPRALNFYQNSGFKAKKQWVELCLDPRQTGLLKHRNTAYPLIQP